MDYLLGLLTLPILAVAATLVWLLAAVARVLWRKVDHALYENVKLARNRAIVFGEDTRPNDHSEVIDTLSHALAQIPRLHKFTGFGWFVLAVRESKPESKA